MLSLVEEAQAAGDRVVIVSYFTSILDAAESALSLRQFGSMRLDGSVAADQRTKLVADFNAERNAESFVFLLSAKAGGIGLNLVSANRLILLDPDWNPANDQQAMGQSVCLCLLSLSVRSGG